jgi:tetratricopeptide (TPR) repeat protein
VSVANTDQRAVVTQQLSEARTLLSNGSVSEAIDRLHSVINLDPSNLEAHRMLGAALVRGGRRRQAIDEYFIAAQKGPQDVDTLQTLATLQFQEQLYADAVDSYRRLATALGAGTLPPADELNYADALRLAGYTEDSRTEYQKLAAGQSADIAAVAKQRLAQLPPQGATGLLNARAVPASAAVANNNAAATSPSQPSVTATPATPRPAPTAARPDADAEYALGVSIVAGRDPKNMPRAELLRALGAAQRGAQGGQHRDQASRLAERLGREFDRRKSSGIQ